MPLHAANADTGRCLAHLSSLLPTHCCWSIPLASQWSTTRHAHSRILAQPVPTPLLQILVELAELQDNEVGDGTTSVVIVAAELLKRANDLVRNKIHPTSIIGGYRLAMREVSFSARCIVSFSAGCITVQHATVSMALQQV